MGHMARRKKKEGIFSKKNLMSIFIVALMVFSVFGVLFYGFNEGSNTVKEKDITFKRADGYWKAEIGDVNAEIDYLPSEIEHIEVDSSIMDRLRDVPQFETTAELNGSSVRGMALAQYRLAQNLYQKDVFVGVGSAFENEYDLPIITCENSTEFVPVVYMKEGNETKVYQEGNCIILQGKDNYDFVILANKMIYGILGVI